MHNLCVFSRNCCYVIETVVKYVHHETVVKYVHHVMGVCCVVFDIDGMLFDFFLNFLNIEKQLYFMFFWRFMLFPTK